jgi:hypothetical protein
LEQDPGRTSVGKHLGYEVEEIAKVIASGGNAKQILHYTQINKKLLAELEKGRGRVLITQGQLKGGDRRRAGRASCSSDQEAHPGRRQGDTGDR